MCAYICSKSIQFFPQLGLAWRHEQTDFNKTILNNKTWESLEWAKETSQEELFLKINFRKA